MFHVCDWLPTFYKAAGGDLSTLKNLDGLDSWEMLSTNGKSVRSKMLHNINPLDDSAAVRVGDYKLLVGNIMSGWDGWYPPYQLYKDQELLHYSNYTDETFQSTGMLNYRENLQKQYHKHWPKEVTWKELQAFYQKSEIYSKFRSNVENENLMFLSERENSILSGTPVTLNCGPKPSNGSVNCQLSVTPCLYHIPSDPCEYNNLAYTQPQVVTGLLKELKAYVDTMVPPGNKPYDDAGNSTRHSGAWVPWQ